MTSELTGKTALVTGCAGFVGSHLTDRLLAEGAEVRGIDSMSPYYDRALKKRNLAGALAHPRFSFHEQSIVAPGLQSLLRGVDVVFHLAAQPGVRGSWGRQFELYVHNNVIATQTLLEAAVAANVPRLVAASSSSVYGDSPIVPTPETEMLRPISPYGVTKAAGEHLCLLYGHRYDIRVVVLRFFTVYGPRQRPDMAFARFAAATEAGEAIPLFGNGEQTRDFTFIDDVVQANVLAATVENAAGTYNVGGGSVRRLKEAIDLIGELTSRSVRYDHRDVAPGDVRATSADIRLARTELGYQPRIALESGLARQIEWLRQSWAGHPTAPSEASASMS